MYQLPVELATTHEMTENVNFHWLVPVRVLEPRNWRIGTIMGGFALGPPPVYESVYVPVGTS